MGKLTMNRPPGARPYFCVQLLPRREASSRRPDTQVSFPQPRTHAPARHLILLFLPSWQSTLESSFSSVPMRVTSPHSAGARITLLWSWGISFSLICARLQEFELLSYIIINLLHKLTTLLCLRTAACVILRGLTGQALLHHPTLAVRDSMTSSAHNPSCAWILVGAP